MTAERRPAIELRATGSNPRRLVGYAAVFDSVSEDLGGFREIVKPGAFKRSLESNGVDPLALVHHLPYLVLGRRSAGTLKLDEDSKGLAFEIDMPDTTTARDLAVSVERGDIKGASFAFTVPEGGDTWDVGDQITRELLDVTLHEITVTATPAYPETSVARRQLDTIIRPRPRLMLARRFLETV